jgi:glycine cleavage system transcriptional repressor
MLMLRMEAEKESVRNLLQSVYEKMELFFHVGNIVADLHRQVDPNYRLSVHGAVQVGIVAVVIRTLAKSDFNILNLESDVGGSKEKPVYIMHIEGFANCGRVELERSLQSLKKEKEIVMHLVPVDTMVG